MPNGSCWCKAVTYSYTGTASMKIICHCLSCQKISGTAFTTNLFIPKSSLTLTPTSRAHLKTYIQPHETGLPITIYFCAACATTLWKHGGSEKYDDFWVVQAGTLDAEVVKGGDALGGEDGEGKEVGVVRVGGRKSIDLEVPEEEYWTDCRAGWLRGVEGLKQFRGFA